MTTVISRMLSCYKLRMTLITFAILGSFTILTYCCPVRCNLGYRNWPGYGLCWSGWYWYLAHHECGWLDPPVLSTVAVPNHGSVNHRISILQWWQCHQISYIIPYDTISISYPYPIYDIKIKIISCHVISYPHMRKDSQTQTSLLKNRYKYHIRFTQVS